MQDDRRRELIRVFELELIRRIDRDDRRDVRELPARIQRNPDPFMGRR
jgi:hypothetical protein